MSETKRYEELAKIIGSHYYGSVFETQLLSDHGSYVYRLKFKDSEKDAGHSMDKVIKIAKPLVKASSLREQKVFASLSSMGFEVPMPEYTQKDKPFSDSVYFIVPWIPGLSLEEIYTKNPENAIRTVQRIGRFIKRLSDVSPDRVDGALNAEEARRNEISTWSAAWGIFKQNRKWVAPIVFDLMEASKKMMEKSYHHLVHRDGPQVITDGAGHFAVIDWADAGAGHPLRSLGIKTGEYLIWMKEPIREQDWRNWLIQGYFRDQPMSVEMEKELRLLTIYYMLLITRSNLNTGNYTEAQRIIGLIKEEYRDM